MNEDFDSDLSIEEDYEKNLLYFDDISESDTEEDEEFENDLTLADDEDLYGTFKPTNKKWKRNTASRIELMFDLIGVKSCLSAEKENKQDIFRLDIEEDDDEEEHDKTSPILAHRSWLLDHEECNLLKEGKIPVNQNSRSHLLALTKLGIYPTPNLRNVKGYSRFKKESNGTKTYSPFKPQLFGMRRFKDAEDLVRTTLKILSSRNEWYPPRKKEEDVVGPHPHFMNANMDSILQMFMHTLTQTGSDVLHALLGGGENDLAKHLSVLQKQNPDSSFNQQKSFPDSFQSSEKIIENGIASLNGEHDKHAVYLGSGYDKTGEVEWLYIGQTKSFQERTVTHKLNISQSWLGAEYTSPYVHQLGKQSHNIDFSALNLIDDEIASIQEITLFKSIAEAAWAFIVCTYRFDINYLRIRSAHGFPHFSRIKGANGTPCFEPLPVVRFQYVSRLNDVLRILRRSVACSWNNRDQIRAVFYAKKQKEYQHLLQNVTVTENQCKTLEKETNNIFSYYRKTVSKLLLNGEYEDRVKRFHTGSNSSFWDLECLRGITLEKSNGENITNSTGEAIGFLKLEAEDHRTACDLFTVVNRLESIVFRGLKLLFSRTKNGPFLPLKQSLLSHGSVKTVKFGMRLLHYLDMDTRYSGIVQRRAEDLRSLNSVLYKVPPDIQDANYMFELINGLRHVLFTPSRAGPNEFLTASKGKPRLFFFLEIPDAAMQRRLGIDHEDTERHKLCIRMNFASDFPYFKNQNLTLEQRKALIGVGFDLQAKDGSWVPSKRQVLHRFVSAGSNSRVAGTERLFQFLTKAREIVTSQGGPVKEFQLSLPIVTETVVDLPEEPDCFKIKQCTVDVWFKKPNMPTTYRISLPVMEEDKRKWAAFPINPLIIQEIFGDDVPRKAKIWIKLAAWGEKRKKSIDEVKLFIRHGDQQDDIWYDNTTKERPLTADTKRKILTMQDNPPYVRGGVQPNTRKRHTCESLPQCFGVFQRKIHLSCRPHQRKNQDDRFKSAFVEVPFWEDFSSKKRGKCHMKIAPSILRNIFGAELPDNVYIETRLDAWNKHIDDVSLFVRGVGTEGPWLDNTEAHPFTELERRRIQKLMDEPYILYRDSSTSKRSKGSSKSREESIAEEANKTNHASSSKDTL